MSASKPIEVVLNMHSSSLCQRYFVYHHENGTLIPYTILEQNFINGVSSYYQGGFAAWNYFVSWTSGTPLQYPESWFWQNYGESVMALTYEDMYQCTGISNFDLTANSILRGVMDYMQIATSIEDITDVSLTGYGLSQNYPNPFNPSTTINYQLPISSQVVLKVYDILGNEVATLVDEYKSSGRNNVEFRTNNLASGIYYYQLRAEEFSETKKMILLR